MLLKVIPTQMDVNHNKTKFTLYQGIEKKKQQQHLKLEYVSPKRLLESLKYQIVNTHLIICRKRVHYQQKEQKPIREQYTIWLYFWDMYTIFLPISLPTYFHISI